MTKTPKAAKAVTSDLPTRITFPANFAELTQTFLDEEQFFKRVVPAFEKARDGLVRIVAKDKKLCS